MAAHARIGLLTVTVALALSGQPTRIFTGIALDPSSARIAGATVELVLTGSTEVVTSAHTGPDGRFVILAPTAGQYDIRLRSTGFKATQVRVEKANSAEAIDIGNIVMEVIKQEIIYEAPSPLVPLLWFPLVEPLDSIDTDVCELLRDPARFRKVEVRLRTVISTYGIDTSPDLVDRNCPSVGLGFGPANEAVNHDESYRKVATYIKEYRPMTVTLLGRLDYAIAIGREPINLFYIEAVSDIIAGQPTRQILLRKSKK